MRLKSNADFRGVSTPTPHAQVHGGDPGGHQSPTFLTKAENDDPDEALLPLLVANTSCSRENSRENVALLRLSASVRSRYAVALLSRRK